MPSPDEPEHPGNSPERQLSTTEQHFNQIILAMLAIGTTVLAATLVVYGLSEEVPGTQNTLRTIQAAATAFATGVYVLAFLLTVRTLFPASPPDGTSSLVQKRRAASTVVSLFGVLAICAAAVILIEIISSDSGGGP